MLLKRLAVLSILPARCLLLLPTLSVAADAPEAGWSHSGNAMLVSDYVFRGVTPTQGKPMGQLTLDFAHANGAYIGLFGSGVSHAAYNNGSGTEIDVYGGYRATVAPDTVIDAGLVTYWFPGAHYAAAGRDIKYHTQEWKLGVNIGALNVYGWVSSSSAWFGFAVDPATGKYQSTRGTGYLEANWNPELRPGTVLNLHAGRQAVRRLGGFNYVDVKIGITQTWGNWAVSANATHNNGKAERGGVPYWRFFNADGSHENVAGSRVFVTAARNF